MNNKSKRIALCAVSLALMIALAPLPYVFLIPLLVLSVCFGWGGALAAGAVFGTVSYLFSFMGGSPVSAAFIAAPWIPIVPRLFVGLAARSAYIAGKKLFKDKAKGALPYVFAGAFGSIANTALVVLSLLFLMPGTEFNGVTLYGYVPVMLISGAIELVINSAVLAPLALTLNSAAFGSAKTERTVKLAEDKVQPYCDSLKDSTAQATHKSDDYRTRENHFEKEPDKEIGDSGKLNDGGGGI